MAENNLTNYESMKRKKYRATENGKMAIKKYARSDKCKQVMKSYIIRNKNKWRARIAINMAVYLGKMERVKNKKCCFCKNMAFQYHHHLGYNREHWMDVIPLCKECHIKEHHFETVSDS